MPPLKDITGRRFGRWVALRSLRAPGDSTTFWECRCDCGATKSVQSGHLIGGKSKSCGCARREMLLRRNYRGDIEERFWAKVRIPANVLSDCWLWTAGAKSSGYGAIGIDGKNTVASRFSWEAFHGPIPAGLQVLHRCDNRPCVNTAHLFLGTIADNMADRDAKGRQASRAGRNNGRAKLTDDQALEIRSLKASGVTARALAARFGVDETGIYRIARGAQWRHINFKP